MICELCKIRKYEHAHHMFSDSKLNRKLYGDLMDDDRNVMFLCSVCHLNKSIPKYSEIEFCKIMGIKPRSKSGIELYKRFI